MGDKVFVGSCSGVFFALDDETGKLRWSYDTRQDAGPAQFHGDPVAVGDLIVTSSDSADPSFVYAFERATGRLAWKRDVDAPETDLLNVGGRLVGRSGSGDLVALDPTTGELIWKVADGGTRCGRRVRSPAAHQDAVFFVDKDGRLRAVGGEDGSGLWSREVGCAAGAPRIWEDRVYVGLTTHEIVALSLDNGDVVARCQTEDLPHSRLTPAGDLLVALIGEKKLVALSRDLSRQVWELTTESDWSAVQPLIWNQRLIVGDAGGNLLALDPADGFVHWSTRLEGTLRGLGAAQEVLYVGTLQGPLYAYRPPPR